MNHFQSNLSPKRKTQTSHFLNRRNDQLTRTEHNLESDSPFCRTCTANQVLQMNLLSNYLPNEIDEDGSDESNQMGSSLEIQRLLDDLPNYKASLEARYPVLCSECSPKVSSIIQKRNYKSKAYVLHSSARRLSQLSSTHHSINQTRPDIISPFDCVGFQRPLIKGMGSRVWVLQEWIWRLRGLLWIFSHLSGVLVNLFYASPLTLGLAFLCDNELQTNHSKLDSTPYICYPSLLKQYRSQFFIFHLLELFWAFFDFTWSQVRQNKAQGIQTKLIGRSSYLCFNAVAYFLRLFSFVLTQEGFLSYLRRSRWWIPDLVPLRNPRTFGIISITLAMLFISCLYSLRIDSPIRLTYTKKPNVQSTLSSNPSIPIPVSDEDLFSTLSLNASHNLSSTHKLQQNSSSQQTPIFGESTELSNPLRNTLTQVEEKDQTGFEKMDWEPIMNRSDSMINQETGLLNPQTFLPPLNHREEIGIEDLFKESFKVSGHEESNDRKEKRGSRSWIDWVFWKRIEKEWKEVDKGKEK